MIRFNTSPASVGWREESSLAARVKAQLFSLHWAEQNRLGRLRLSERPKRMTTFMPLYGFLDAPTDRVKAGTVFTLRVFHVKHLLVGSGGSTRIHSTVSS